MRYFAVFCRTKDRWWWWCSLLPNFADHFYLWSFNTFSLLNSARFYLNLKRTPNPNALFLLAVSSNSSYSSLAMLVPTRFFKLLSIKELCTNLCTILLYHVSFLPLLSTFSFLFKHTHLNIYSFNQKLPKTPQLRCTISAKTQSV